MTRVFYDENLQIFVGDCREQMAAMDAQSVQTIVTSPPYWGLRDYGNEGQLGLEPTPSEYVASMVQVFGEAKRVLRDDGTLWLNLGDTYSAQRWTGKGEGQPINKKRDGHRDLNATRESGLPAKNLVGIPWLVAFALQADGWVLRSEIIWHKPGVMPEPVTDRPTRAHEQIFLFAKQQKYHYDHEAIKEPAVTGAWDALPPIGGKKHPGENGNAKYSGNQPASDGMRNKRDVWTVSIKPYAGAHFATFPPDLIEPCILAGAPPGGVVLDPFGGSGTTGMVSNRLGRKAVLIELNPEYVEQIKERCRQAPLGI
jgi:DNA modification methylase